MCDRRKRYRAEGLARFLRQHYPAAQYSNVLEIGCMFGYLMEALRRDYRVKGIDLGTEAIRFAGSADWMRKKSRWRII